INPAERPCGETLRINPAERPCGQALWPNSAGRPCEQTLRTRRPRPGRHPTPAPHPQHRGCSQPASPHAAPCVPPRTSPCAALSVGYRPTRLPALFLHCSLYVQPSPAHLEVLRKLSAALHYTRRSPTLVGALRAHSQNRAAVIPTGSQRSSSVAVLGPPSILVRKRGLGCWDSAPQWEGNSARPVAQLAQPGHPWHTTLCLHNPAQASSFQGLVSKINNSFLNPPKNPKPNPSPAQL
ncbi:hypothetical protein DV515_00009865, partial [Chloebia gouldiae]